ncbi:RluA family pseudouridine synthase [Acidipropionibacterium acidipropionici]|uniref:Pseudouridine synthase n=1 Tax=Acidipropionibacterium acidipropionici TaxID=1748 RepID=A0AAC8YHV9_9ACTN|nr:RluA family pseudouridine synthase [Acidipropionibacterium acidipropionici]AMS06799.1 RNA pseudouridine synthase [Acidipropionibacterium acidipropionici]AOZ45585.1 RNA pseudouridine synthase [Acidipropionibacterium acidipropionici]AZP38407.1 RluA family pseudouridine synthase [Acidipropionibacterium acidipropionici]
MSVLLVPDGLDGSRVDAAAARMTGVSRSRISDLVGQGKVLLQGEPVRRSSTRVTRGQMLEVDLSDPAPEASVTPRLVEGMGIVHDDADIVVVDKPAGVAAHPSLGWDGPSVVEHLAAAGFSISTSGAAERRGIVQRLDVGTSGLMVVAKSERAYTLLKRAFRERTVDKIYLALVQGHPDPFDGTVDAPIGRHPGHDWKMAVVEGGRHSVTHYETVEAFRSTTLLRIHLETGRTHQIRVHMSAVRHPCCGDPLYGCDPVMARELGLDRQWLHARQLSFDHPATGERVTFLSPLPADLRHALDVASAPDRIDDAELL